MKRIIAVVFILISGGSLMLRAQGVLFSNTYGSGQFNYGVRTIQDKDGGYFIIGNESPVSGNSVIHIIRTDSLGVILSEKMISDFCVYSARDFIRTEDRGFVITGVTNINYQNFYDLLLIKLDSSLNMEWIRNFGGSDWDEGAAVRETSDGSLVVAGSTYSSGAGDQDYYVIKTDASGNQLWWHTFGGDSADYATSLCITAEGNYLVGGATKSFGHGDFDGWLVLLDAAGTSLYSETYGDVKEDILYSVQNTADSGFVFAGSTRNYGAYEREVWVVKAGSDWVQQWMMPEFWEIGTGDDVAYSITVDDSSCYVITGFSTGLGNGLRDIIMLRMADNHVFKCSFSDGSERDDIGVYGVQTADQGFIVTGTTEGLGPAISNIYLAKTGNDCSKTGTHIHILDVEENSVQQQRGNLLFPTVGNGIFHFIPAGNSGDATLGVFDMQGRVVHDAVIVRSDQSSVIDLSRCSNGVYIVVYNGPESQQSFKIVKCSQ